MSTAVITIAAGRHDHLAAQSAALARSTVAPDRYVVVSMGDPDLGGVVPHADVVSVAPLGSGLPLAAARNAGARRAAEHGANLLVFLDVDCLPATTLLSRYASAARDHPGVLCGPVGYLPPRPVHGYPERGLHELATPHPARPVPAEDEVRAAEDFRLFWSLSFAVPIADWDRVGGFCEDYHGYGGEDTDFGRSAQEHGLAMWWVGGAWAYHQYHGEPGPPTRHLEDIVRNAGIYHRRWGNWPMLGWLTEFERQGLLRRDTRSGAWVRTHPS